MFSEKCRRQFLESGLSPKIHDAFYCAGTGPVMHGLATVKTETVWPTAITTEDGVIGRVHLKPTGFVRNHIYFNLKPMSRQLCVKSNSRVKQ